MAESLKRKRFHQNINEKTEDRVEKVLISVKLDINNREKTKNEHRTKSKWKLIKIE